MLNIKLFLTHFFCYWIMVLLYDTDIPSKDLDLAIYSSLKNQVFYTLPIFVLFSYNYPIVYSNFTYSTLYMPFLVVTSDVYFYITHIPLHSRYLYKIHKHHHINTVCVAKSLDANGFEHIVGNMGTFFFGILSLWYFNIILNMYIIVSWIGLVTIINCASHSNNKCFLDNSLHNNHHKYRNCNYGFGIYLMDRIMNTYKK